MFFYTDTADAPWTVVKSNDKKRARLNAMRHVLSRFDYSGKDLHVVTEPDPLIIMPARTALGRSGRDGWGPHQHPASAGAPGDPPGGAHAAARDPRSPHETPPQQHDQRSTRATG